MVQIAICAVLVTSSLVAVRGLVRSLHSNFGFQPQGAMLVDTDLDMAGYSGDQVTIMQRRAIEAVGAIPGVTAVGLVDRPPLGLGFSTMRLSSRTRDRYEAVECGGGGIPIPDLSRLLPCGGHSAADRENVHVAGR